MSWAANPTCASGGDEGKDRAPKSGACGDTEPIVVVRWSGRSPPVFVSRFSMSSVPGVGNVEIEKLLATSVFEYPWRRPMFLATPTASKNDILWRSALI